MFIKIKDYVIRTDMISYFYKSSDYEFKSNKRTLVIGLNEYKSTALIIQFDSIDERDSAFQKLTSYFKPNQL